MIVSVFVRRLKEGATFGQFEAEWLADRGYGIPTRVFNAQSLEDERDVLSIGFVAATAAEVTQWLAQNPSQDAERHDRVDTVIESTTLHGFYDLGSEHDFTTQPVTIGPDTDTSLLAPLQAARVALDARSQPHVSE
jgi:hypothetical protein